ncbi:hypothetical protein [Roseovarius nitratireducens]|uniref:hypothetical protein n=1 Tax=Roseovarius nitratireducens TaxID=2044597 RepID=UPI000CE2852A|nr:hypothetical protein [Roseovarius nitratireducens]
MTPDQLERHRSKIAVRAEAILDQFWRDDDTSDAQRALELEGWADVLETCSHSEIRKAWAEYQKTGPRTRAGRLYKPDAGALYRIIVKRRPPPPPSPFEAPPKRHGPRVPPEDVQEKLRSLGIKSMPKPGDGARS